MQFSNKKKALAAGMIAVGGLALVGVGTGAAFTDTVTANSTYKAGTADLDITEAANFTVSNEDNTATLTHPRLIENSFITDGYTFKVTNNGDIKVPLTITSNVTGVLDGKVYVTAAPYGANNHTLPVVNGQQWLAPEETATVIVYVESTHELTNADSGKTGGISVAVSGTM